MLTLGTTYSPPEHAPGGKPRPTLGSPPGREITTFHAAAEVDADADGAGNIPG